MSFRILLPCVPFTARVNVFGSGKPTPFERAVLKYLWAEGGASLTQIVEFLGLGRAIAFDLLVGLWNRRWAEVHLTTGIVTLASDLEDMVGKDEFEGLRSADNAIELRFIYELINGNVAPLVHESALRGPGGEAYTYPKLPRQKETGARRYPMDLTGFRQASQGELLRALKMHPIYARIRNDDLGNLEIEVPEPETQISPRHVRFVGVFFDPILTETGSLELKVNDDRPELRLLGLELQDIIADSLPQESPLLAALVDAAEHRATGATERPLPLSAFMRHVRGLEDMALSPDDPIRAADLELLRDLWEEARARVTMLAERRADLGTSTQTHVGRGAVDAALRAAVTRSSGAFVLTSPVIDARYLAEGDETLLRQIEKLHASEGRNLYIQTAAATAKNALESLTPLGDSATTIFSQRPPGAMHTRSSLALFDRNKLMIGSEPLLGRGAETALTVCYSPRNLGLGTNALQDLLDRLAKDFALDSDAGHRLRREAFGEPSRPEGDQTTEADEAFRSTVKAIDGLIGRIAGQGASKSDDDGAEQTTRLAVRELGQRAAALDHWILVESQSADLLFDSEIHDQVLELVRSAPPNHPLAIGLSSPRDLTQNAAILGAIAKRTATATAPVYLHLPSDEKLCEVVDELIQRFKGADRVSVSVSRQGTRWGFGFALAPGRCILSAQGVGHRIRNAGRNRPGTEVGLALYGETLCKKAIALLGVAHDLTSYQREIPRDWSKPTRTTDGLLEIFEKWKATENPTHDGNAGVNTVMPFLVQKTPVPWKPSDPLLNSWPRDLHYAILKAAALVDRGGNGAERQAYHGAARAYAIQCLREGRFGHAAILAEHLEDNTLAQPLIRKMLFAWACGTPVHLEAEDLSFAFDETAQREVFLLMATLLVLDGLASELSPWLAGQYATFKFEEGPLDHLARSAFVWAAQSSAITYRATEATQFRDTASVEEIWKKTARQLAWWREKGHDSFSVRAVRDVIFANPTEPLGELRLLFESTKSGPTAAHLASLRLVLARHPELSSPTALLDPSRRRKLALRYFESASSKAEGDAIVGSGRTAYENYTLQAFDLVADLITVMEGDNPERRATGVLVAAARNFLNSSDLERKSIGGDRERAACLTDALRARLTSDGPQPPLLPPWVLPTAPLGGREPDWQVLRDSLMTCELPDASSEGLAQALERLAEGEAGWSADALEQDPLLVGFRLLRRCVEMRGDALPSSWIDRARRNFVTTLANRTDQIIREIAGLRVTKHRAGLVDAEFERKATAATEMLATLRNNLSGGAEASEQLIAELAKGRAIWTALNERLGQSLRVMTGELLDGTVPEDRAYLREILDGDMYDLARHLKLTLDRKEEIPQGPSQTTDAAAAFSTIVWQSSTFDRVRQGLVQFAAERGLGQSDTEFVDMLGTIMRAALEGRAPAVQPEKFFVALLKYLGAELSSSDKIEAAQGLWLLHSEAPSVVALAPYLSYDEAGARRISIAVPWTKERLVALDLHFALQGGSWRSVVFPVGTRGETPAEHQDISVTLSDLGRLVRGAKSDAGSGQDLPHVPLVLTLFSRQHQTSLPNITHANVVAWSEAPPYLRALSITRHLAGQATPQELRCWWDRKDGDPERHKASLMAAILGGTATPGLTTETSTDPHTFLSGIATRFGVEMKGKDVHHHRNRLCLRATAFYSGRNMLNALDLFFASLDQRGRHVSLALPPALMGKGGSIGVHRLLGRLLPSVAKFDPRDILVAAQALEDAIILAVDASGADFALKDFLQCLEDELRLSGREALARVNAASLTAEMVSSGLVVPGAGEPGNRYRPEPDIGLLALAASLG